jgi:hypothetical protein
VLIPVLDGQGIWQALGKDEYIWNFSGKPEEKGQMGTTRPRWQNI